jgi:hypothetical protein
MVLAWVSERLAVAMRQAEDEDNVLDKPTLIDLEARWGDKGQVMDDCLRCNVCAETDHEGKFCRCESRNIRIAKEMRTQGESPWITSQPERLSELALKGDAIV